MVDVELYLLVLSVLFIISIMSDKIGYKLGIPALLLFLLVGMLFGVDGIGLQFSNISLAQAIGTCSLCIILFSGGMDTKFENIKPIIAPGIILATLGVALMAGITGFTWWLLGQTPLWQPTALSLCLLIGATMSSTDSASVFSILRSRGINLKYHLQPMLELESGSNDPMAYVLTISMIGIVNAGSTTVDSSLSPFVYIVFIVLVQIILGAIFGFVLGNLLVWFINKIAIKNPSLYPIMVLASCIFIFSVAYYLYGNPYLAVYIGGLIFGNSKFAHKTSTLGFFDGISWLCQLIMFLTLGLLIDPSDMLTNEVWLPALILSVIMIFIARPLSTYLCLLPWRKSLPLNARTFVAWVGLRGASPIIFAILVVSAEVPGGKIIFEIVFFCTLLSLLIQGTSIPFMSRLLNVEKPAEKRKNIAVVGDVDMFEETRSVSKEVQITDTMLNGSNLLMDMGLPPETLAIMVRRPRRSAEGEVMFVPTGKTELRVGDHLLVISNTKESLDNLAETMEEHARTRNVTIPPIAQKCFDYVKYKFHKKKK